MSNLLNVKAIAKFNPESNGILAKATASSSMEIKNLITGAKLGSNLDQSVFTQLIEKYPELELLLNTQTSRMLRAMRNGSVGGDFTMPYSQDSEGNYTLKDIPKMSFSPMTAEPDDCCVVAGNLQVCEDETVLKPLCLEQCETEMEQMMGQIGWAGRNSAVYQAYTQMMRDSGVSKSAMPTQAEFEQLSLIAQFILLNALTFINGLLEVEQNGNIVRRFSGLAQIYSNPDVMPISGANGVIDAFDQAMCRMNMVGTERFAGGFWLASRTAYSAIQKAIVPKRDGNYPSGWTVTETTRNVNGFSVPEKRYFFMGNLIQPSQLLFIDDSTLQGDIYFVPQSVGVFSAVPLDVPAPFLMQEWDKPRSAFVHYDKETAAYPTCYTSCDRLTNFGAVIATEANDLIKITGIESGCDAEVFQGIEGLININSYAPYVA